MNIKENIKKYRLANNMTLEEVANKLGVSKPTVQRYESGAISNIPIDKILKLSEIFNIIPTDLLNWNKDLDSTKSLFKQIEFKLGSEATQLMCYYLKLNKNGKIKALEYVSDLSEQNKYTLD